MDDELRAQVRARAEYRCEYCRIPQRYFYQIFHIEHIISKSHGGDDDPDNLALACRLCNLHKGPNLSGIDPEGGQLTPLFNPRRESWQDHFRTDESGQVTGLTNIGRTTVRVLNMNATHRVDLRSAIASLEQ
ncbi:MAG: HNH endonuclease [Planctomycetes bacterium]|nr:HNH endonuclease [Planctomycetota bacterium]